MLIPTQISQIATTSTSSSSFVTGGFVNPQSLLYPSNSFASKSKPATTLNMVDPSVVSSVPGWVKFCSNMAPLASMAVLTAPYPTIQQVVKEKTVGNLPLLPYSSMVANCFLWTVYGSLVQESKIWVTNGIGLALGAFYFFRFIKFAPKGQTATLPGSVRQHAQACMTIILGTFAWALACFMTIQKKGNWAPYAAKLIGNAAVALCLVMFASPLSALKTVLKTKSARSIPLPFTLATVLNCFFWSVAGLKDFKDFTVYFPNICGLCLGLTQVALKVVFGNGTPATTMTKAEMDAELAM